MSFAGHVIDMMRRYKENRQVIGRHRDQAKDRIKHSLDSRTPRREWDHLDVETLTQNSKDTETKRQKEQYYYYRILIGILVIVLVVVVLLFIN